MPPDDSITNASAPPEMANLREHLDPCLEPLGYEIIHCELVGPPDTTLRIYIDRLRPQPGPTASYSDGLQRPLELEIGLEMNDPISAHSEATGIGVEDCARASKALDEVLDQLPQIERWISGPYHLEVSSPGIERPLSRPEDFRRFQGRRARIFTFRPLDPESSGDLNYYQLHPRRKNFLGVLDGLSPDGRKLYLLTPEANRLGIDLSLINKAHLEPESIFGLETSPSPTKASHSS